MKRITTYFLFITISASIIAVLFLPQSAQAVQSVREGLNQTAGRAGITTSDTDLSVMIGRTINYLFGILGVVFLTVVLIGGFMWMTAGGNDEKVAKAKGWVINGINGMLVIFLAYALVYTILVALRDAIR